MGKKERRERERELKGWKDRTKQQERRYREIN